MDEIIVNNLPENTSPTAADMLMLIRTADGELTQVSVEDLGDVIGGTAEVFWAIYGTTTNAQIDAAEAAGKVLLCRYNNRTYALGQNAGSYATFYSIDTDQNRCYYLSCGEDDWDNGYFSIGTYSKPSGGIPKTDLASAVQTSLGKADTALQSVPNTYRTAAAQDTIDSGKIDKPSSPATGAFLVWNGSAWVAQTLATWSGGSY